MTETKPEGIGFKAVGSNGASPVTSTETKFQTGTTEVKKEEVKTAEVKQPEAAKVVATETKTEAKPAESNIFDSLKAKVPMTAKYSSTYLKNIFSFVIVGIFILSIAWHYRASIVTRLDDADMGQIEITDNNTTTDNDDNSLSAPTDLATSATGSVQFGWQVGQAYLGIHYVNIDTLMQKNAKLPVNYGALVLAGKTQSDLAVVPGGPADKAGIVAGDIILEADNMKLDEKTTTLGTVVAQKAAGEVITLKILHEGVEKTVQLTLGTVKESGK